MSSAGIADGMQVTFSSVVVTSTLLRRKQPLLNLPRIKSLPRLGPADLDVRQGLSGSSLLPSISEPMLSTRSHATPPRASAVGVLPPATLMDQRSAHKLARVQKRQAMSKYCTRRAISMQHWLRQAINSS